MNARKKLAALTSAAVMAAGVAAGKLVPEVGEAASAPKPDYSGRFPNRSELRAMPKEKRDYWARRIVEAGNPAYYRKPRVIQYLAAKNPAADPEPITRQVRRQNERTATKMPLELTTEQWHKLKGYGKINTGKAKAA